MRETALKARQRRRFKRKTDSLHAFPIAPNLLNQDFNATGPNQKWGADISYVWTREGWLYLAVVIDLFARRVVGGAAADRLHKELAFWPSAGPSPCGAHPPGSFPTRTVAANTAPSSARLS
jgi:putative transposase